MLQETMGNHPGAIRETSLMLHIIHFQVEKKYITSEKIIKHEF